ncbi:MAG TPA: DUF2071 domain-containing protein [Myxococcota bacterium]|nr:DUF2071 domain-containing protein [Myxococcota bacterium]
MLAMLSWEIDPRVLAPLVPAGCTLDAFRGRTLISLVGFQFLKSRVAGIPALGHSAFDEVNLRFYVRREHSGGVRRGVVFVRELVAKPLVRTLANTLYAERYVALPMRHRDAAPELAYEWRRGGVWEGLRVATDGEPFTPADDAEETFISEHYWGYTARPGARAFEYRVEHPRWRVWRAREAKLDADVRALYGDADAEALAAAPCSAFVAEGSPVAVRWRTSIH